MKKLSNNWRVNPCHSAQVPLDLKFSDADMTKAICQVLEKHPYIPMDDMFEAVRKKLSREYVRKYRLNPPASPLS